jgi:hypothetical protein
MAGLSGLWRAHIRAHRLTTVRGGVRRCGARRTTAELQRRRGSPGDTGHKEGVSRREDVRLEFSYGI